jgi:hypothetical protein
MARYALIPAQNHTGITISIINMGLSQHVLLQALLKSSAFAFLHAFQPEYARDALPHCSRSGTLRLQKALTDSESRKKPPNK